MFVLHFVAVGAKRKSTGLPAPSHARSVSYVNSKKQDDTELGRLMHDLRKNECCELTSNK